MANFVQHEPCPRCGSRDNLGRYDDGSAFCFGCHYREPPSHSPRIEFKKTEDTRSYPKIPEDAGHDFSQEAVEWLAKYDVSLPEAILRGLLWSDSRKQLIFDIDTVWQARNFGYSKHGNTAKSKYFTAGDVNGTLPIYFRNNSSSSNVDCGTSLILVEDCLSAIKIARQSDSMPLLGSNLPTIKLNRLARLYSRLIVWLDHDKLKEAMKIADRAKLLGLSTKVVYTELDPKEYSDSQIMEHLK